MENNIAISHLFKESLLILLSNNEGVIIRISDEIKPMFPNVEKVIVFKINGDIKIVDYDGDLENGEHVNIETQ